ncbi:hypothetical protein PRZ48_007269 [Zasmidium cellare]|uniref:Uncharacterized protein n=1 Tax=Zasmidium cellare TaxID=395010 RepID=A0ABR0EJP4_ZASCE|nr:hypothetical protein PRZ48_007269 [Zasmidium cellare]
MGKCRTQTPTPTIPGAPNTAVAFNTTLTSPTVYIVFEGELIGKSDGQSFSDVKRFLVPQSSTAVSSYCGKIGGGVEDTPHSFNFAHLNGLVPADAYRCQPRCFSHPLGVAEYTTTYTKNGSVTTATSATWSDYATENLCSTIWNDYDPMLSIPPELSTMLFSEASSGCNFTAMPEGILFDPPLALTEAEHADKPTAPAPAPAPAEPTPDIPSPTAEPGGVPDTTLPSPTGESAPEQASPTGAGALPQGDEDDDSGETPEPPPLQDDGADIEAPPPQTSTTSRNIGGIIASAVGITSAQNDPPPEPSTAISPSQPPEPSAVQPAPNGDRPDEEPQDNVDSSAQGQAPVAVITDSNNQEVSVFQDPTAPVALVGSTALSIGETLNVPNVGAVIVQSSGVVVDGSSLAFSNPQGSPAPTPGAVIQGSQGQVFTVAPVSGDHVVVGSSTLAVGETASISGIGNVAVEANGVVVDGTTHDFSTIAEPSHPVVVTAGGRAFTAGSDGEFTVASGEILEVGMTTSVPGVGNVALESNAVVIDGTTHSFSTTPGPSDPGVITDGGHTFTLGSDGGLIISPGQVLTPGGEVIVSGTTYSLDPQGSVAVINGVPQTVVGGSPNNNQASTTTKGDTSADGASSQPPTATASGTNRPLTQTSIAASGPLEWRGAYLTSLMCLGLITLLCM